MIFIDSPAIGEGLDVWNAHLEDLKSMPEKMQKDESLKFAIKRAQRVINIMKEYEKGIDVSKLSKSEFKALINK